MDNGYRLLLFIHLVAMAMAVSTNLVMPMLGRSLAGLPADARQIMASLSTRLKLNGLLSLLILVATGGAMVALRHGAYLWSNPWFVAKMSFVVLIMISLIASFLQRGSGISVSIVALISRVALAGVVFCAVMSFS